VIVPQTAAFLGSDGTADDLQVSLVPGMELPPPAIGMAGDEEGDSPSRARRLLLSVRSLLASLTTTPSPDTSELIVESADPRDEDCPVCLVPLTEACVKTPCGHYFHRACLEQYFLVARTPGARARCPLCRGVLHAPMPVEATARSGRPIEVVAVPSPGSVCHLDRNYVFTSLGGFARPRMLYLLTPNEDRRTPATHVMWTLQA